MFEVTKKYDATRRIVTITTHWPDGAPEVEEVTLRQFYARAFVVEHLSRNGRFARLVSRRIQHHCWTELADGYGGYDDDEVARHLSPPLTSMNLASRAMGRWVIDQLFHGAVGGNQRHPLTKLECELVERESIGPPKA